MSGAPRKRTRKNASVIETGDILSNSNNIQMSIQEPSSDVKKRGRKPKGGKIVTKELNHGNVSIPVANVILHLKCSTKELNPVVNDSVISNPLDYNAEAPPEIMTYDTIHNANFSSYNMKSPENSAYHKEPDISLTSNLNKSNEEEYVNVKDINTKLKQLKLSLYKNDMNEKKSACFWCTYD